MSSCMSQVCSAVVCVACSFVMFVLVEIDGKIIRKKSYSLEGLINMLISILQYWALYVESNAFLCLPHSNSDSTFATVDNY